MTNGGQEAHPQINPRKMEELFEKVAAQYPDSEMKTLREVARNKLSNERKLLKKQSLTKSMAGRLFKARPLGDNLTQPKEEGFSCLLSLVDAAALKVTGNLNLTLYALKVIPHHLYPVLLAASIETGLAVSTKAIVGAWPFASLNFSSLQQFTNIPGIRRPDEQHDHPALAAAIAIAEQKEGRIQDIDITSLHLSDRTNNLFLDTLLKGRQAEAECVKKNRSQLRKAHRELRILMNIRVTGQEVKAFFKKSRQLLAANIHVRNKRLWVDQCGTDLVERVLTLVEKERTTELDLSYNSFGNEGLKRILDLIPQFPALTTLCLQYNNLNFTNEHFNSAVIKLATTLQSLPNLKYLNLSANRLTWKLAELLSPMEQALSLLDATYCMFSKEDIEYLSGSHHTRGLEHLLLRDNYDFGRNWNAADRLLRNVADNLVELDLEHCNLGRVQEDVAAHLARLAPRFKCLRSLEIQHNFLSAKDQINVVVAFGKCPTMGVLRLSFPIREMEEECEVIEEGETDPEWFKNTCRKRQAEVQNFHPHGNVMTVYVYEEDLSLRLSEANLPFQFDYICQ